MVSQRWVTADSKRVVMALVLLCAGRESISASRWAGVSEGGSPYLLDCPLRVDSEVLREAAPVVAAGAVACLVAAAEGHGEVYLCGWEIGVGQPGGGVIQRREAAVGAGQMQQCVVLGVGVVGDDGPAVHEPREPRGEVVVGAAAVGAQQRGDLGGRGASVAFEALSGGAAQRLAHVLLVDAGHSAGRCGRAGRGRNAPRRGSRRRRCRRPRCGPRRCPAAGRSRARDARLRPGPGTRSWRASRCVWWARRRVPCASGPASRRSASLGIVPARLKLASGSSRHPAASAPVLMSRAA